jgi:hypothetical protein
MKKSLVAVAIFATFGVAYADPVYNNVATSSGASGSVGSQSASFASSSGNGTALSSTQSGSFSTFGQNTAFVPAPGDVGSGTASVAGFSSTSQYVTSQSASTGSGVASSSSWNSANAIVTSLGQNTTLSGYTGQPSGTASSNSAGNASTSSSGNVFGGVTQIQGNTASNVGGYTASDSAIRTYSTVIVNGVSVPVTNVQTETSAFTFNNSTQSNTTVFNTGSVANVGSGTNGVSNSGSASAVAN